MNPGGSCQIRRRFRGTALWSLANRSAKVSPTDEAGKTIFKFETAEGTKAEDGNDMKKTRGSYHGCVDQVGTSSLSGQEG